MNFDIRTVTSIDDLNRISQLEMAIWGMPPDEVVPSNIMRALTLNGAVAHGAFEGDSMIGMALAFPAVRDGKLLLWSHMAGVLPTHQRRGIGFAIKQAQREWALAHGYEEMRWTFDPIQRGNARFNLHLLGCTASTYYVDHYGAMRDSLNVPAPTDRLEAVWRLKEARVKSLSAGKEPAATGTDILQAPCSLSIGDQGEPIRHEAEIDALHRIELPNIHTLSGDQVLPWRLALRKSFQDAFAHGCRAVDFIESQGRSYYVLRPADAYFMYVLECADGTYYTGIARDLSRRIAQHNNGRGAAYTAARRPVRLLAAWRFNERSAAAKAESAFKAQTRRQKQEAVALRLSQGGAPFISP